MKLSETMTLPLSPADAARMYADQAYADLRRSTLGAREATSSVEGDPAGSFTTTTVLTMPTDRVPEMVRRFVGQSVEVREVQAWQAPEPDGSRRGTIRFDVVGAPASMTGTTTLVPAGEGSSRVSIDGELVAKVPLLGRKIEQAAVPYIAEVLRHEERSAGAYAEGLRR